MSRLTFYYCNADSLPNKKLELLATLHTLNKTPDIIAITEVKAKNSRFDLTAAELAIPGYTMYTPANFTSPTSRGIAIWIKANINATEKYFHSDFSESLWIDVSLSSKDHLLFGCIYRSPNSSRDNNAHLNTLISTSCLANFKHFLVVGDLNYRSINWESSTAVEQQAEDFLNTCNDYFLHQHVRNPTRVRHDQQPSLLDIVLTKNEDDITNLRHLGPLGKSDHSALTFEFLCTRKCQTHSKKITLYHRADYPAIVRDLADINWDQELRECTTQDAYDRFCKYYSNICTRHIPTKIVSGYEKKNRRGISAADAENIRKKHRAWTRYMESRTEVRYKEYKRLRNKVKRITKKAVMLHEKGIADCVKENPKRFWSYVKSKTKIQERIPELINQINNTKTTNDVDKAQILGEFFASVYTTEITNNMPVIIPKSYERPLMDMTVEEEETRRELKKLSPGKASGPDDINPRILRETASTIAKPLTIIFNKSIQTGTLPSQWTQANVTAIHKKGEKSRAENYRPISLTSVPCKILESLIRRRVTTHMKENQLFTPSQYGFVENRSTTLQLLHTLEDWIRNLDDDLYTDVAYLDFQKAFDSVPHERLLLKTSSYGIQGKILNWIRAFLKDRTQAVKVNGSSSSLFQVQSGVPQGSVLGPTLFVLYINDLPDIVDSTVKLYADDAKLYRAIRGPEDNKTLQDDLKALGEWSQRWQLNFNPNKCSMLRIRPRNSTCELYTYKMGSVELEWQEAEKDLGVLMDQRLSFQDEISARIAKANRIVGTIRRTFSFLNADMMKTLFKALVRPHLEYGAPIWSPALRKDVDRLEQVQRRATKMVPELRQLSYPNRLKRLKLPSLAFRRLRGDMVETFKILNHFYDIDHNSFFTLSQLTTRNNSLKIYTPRVKKNIRLNSFSYRIISHWNNLPQSVVTAPSLNSFKNRLDDHWMNHPLKYLA